jgi:hypothetical protein
MEKGAIMYNYPILKFWVWRKERSCIISLILSYAFVILYKSLCICGGTSEFWILVCLDIVSNCISDFQLSDVVALKKLIWRHVMHIPGFIWRYMEISSYFPFSICHTISSSLRCQLPDWQIFVPFILSGRRPCAWFQLKIYGSIIIFFF